MNDTISPALAKSLGKVVADLRREWKKELEVIAAESRATIAELKAANADLIALLKEGVAAQVARVDTALGAVRNGKDAEPADIAAAVDAALEKAVAALPAPKDGADADMAAIQAHIDDAVKAAVAALPPAKDGDPGRDIDPAEIRAMVDEAVAASAEQIVVTVKSRVDDAIASIPVRKDVESLDLEQVKATIVDVAKDIIANQFRQPEDGKDVDMAAVAEMVKGVVDEAVAQIPPAKDGLSVTAEDVAPLIAAEVTRAVATLPPAKDGKDADPEEIKRLVDAAVAALPAPKDGASLTVDELGPVVSEAVTRGLAELDERISTRAAELVGQIPRPKDGESVTVDQVRPILEEMVQALPPPAAGKDADMDQVRSMLEELVRALPLPRDGEDGKSISLEEVVPAIKAHLPELVAEAVTEAVARLPEPAPGKSISTDDVAPMIREEIARAVAALPPAKDGEPGASVDMAVVREAIGSLVKEAVAALPAPKDGDPGTSVTIDDVAPLLEREITARFEALPKPKDGTVPDADTIRAAVAPLVEEAVKALPPAAPGKDVDMAQVEQIIRRAVDEIPRPQDGNSVTVDDVMPAIEERIAAAVKAIPVPKDGVGLAGALIDREGNLIVTLANGEARNLGAVVGRDADRDAISEFIKGEIAKIPVPKDGVDGLGFDDMEVEHDGERSFVLRWARGDVEKSCRIELPVVLDRGVFKDGRNYARGDGVTWGGSYWIAQEETGEKPGDGTKAWRLAVKKGRDGREVVKLPAAVPKLFRLPDAEAGKTG